MRRKVISRSAFIDNIASACMILKAGSVSKDVDLAKLAEAGGPREAVADDPVLSWGIDNAGVVSAWGAPI